MDEEFKAEQTFDQECITALVHLGMDEMEAAFFLGRFLTVKTGESWTLIQGENEEDPKFFVPTSAIQDDGPDPLKN